MTKRPRGSLRYNRHGWSARLYREREGVEVRDTVRLGTHDKSVARVKLAALLAGDPVDASAEETFAAAAARIVAMQREEGLVSANDRAQRLERFARPEFGALPVTRVRASHVAGALRLALAADMSKSTIKHLRSDISQVLTALLVEGAIASNPARGVPLPKGAAAKRKPRVILTDSEFTAFVSHPETPPELRVLALFARCIGGMRTSDLHGWRWDHVDTVGWRSTWIERSKTAGKGSARHALPEPLAQELYAWWQRHGCPSDGPVFPVRRGKRLGLAKARGTSYAPDLRAALWAAGIVRPLPGFERARDEREQKTLCQLQSGDDKHDAVEFHSFRRAFVTALAASGVNVQTAMAAAGHTEVSTHLGYHQPELVVVPPSALPPLGPSVSGREMGRVGRMPRFGSEKPNDSQRARKDSNLRPTAPEAVCGSGQPTTTGILQGETPGVVVPGSPSAWVRPESLAPAHSGQGYLGSLREAQRKALEEGNRAAVDALWVLIEAETKRLAATAPVSLAEARAKREGGK